MNRRADSAKRQFYNDASWTIFLQIDLISKRFELLMPDWFQMKDILMQFKEEKRERDIFKEISRQA